MSQPGKVPYNLRDEKAEAKVLEFIKRCRADFWLFASHILELHRLGKLAPVHRDLCNFLGNTYVNKKLVLLPRGHLKSTIAEAYIVWRLCCDPGIDCFIVSLTNKQAKKFLRGVKWQIEHNPNVGDYFPNVLPDWMKVGDDGVKKKPRRDDEKWGEYEMTVGGLHLKKDNPNREFSVAVSGAEENITGSHASIILLDDIINHLTVRTKANREKTVEIVGQLFSVLKPGQQIIFNGTLYHPDDLYAWLKSLDRFDVFTFPAYWKDEESGDTKILFKQKHVMTDAEIQRDDDGNALQESFETLRKIQGDTMFSHQYLLKAISPSDQVFREMDLRYWHGTMENGRLVATLYYKDKTGEFLMIKPDEEAVFDDMVVTCTAVDPAKSVRQVADETGLSTGSFSYDNRLFMNEAIGFKTNIGQEIFRKVLEHKNKFYPLRYGIEKHGSEWAQEIYNMMMTTQGVERINFQELKPMGSYDQGKKTRISMLQGRIEHHRFYLPLDREPNGELVVKKWVPKFVGQLLDFTMTVTGHDVDDILDATAYLLQLFQSQTPKRRRRETEEQSQRRMAKKALCSVTGY